MGYDIINTLLGIAASTILTLVFVVSDWEADSRSEALDGGASIKCCDQAGAAG